MVPFAAALVLTFLLTGLAVPVLRRALFMDVPNHRSSHTQPVPRGGGLALILVVIVVAVLLVDVDRSVGSLLVGAAALAAVGLADDVRSLPSSVRLGAQVVCALATAAVLLSQGEGTWWWCPVVVISMVGYVNAYNFMDGINGISALTALVVGLWWGWVGFGNDHATLGLLGLILSGASVGFLPWNAPKARVFLGDVGSYGVGFYVVGLSALALTNGIPWGWALAPLVIYGADTGWVLVKRYRGGRPLGAAHREHVYQRLVDGGWSHVASACLCASAAALVCVAVGLSGEQTALWAWGSAVVVTIGYLGMPRLVHAGGRS